MKAKKFTFKTNKPTGKFAWVDKNSHYIKLDGISLGSIDDSFPHKIQFKVVKADINEDGNPNCPWKWVRLKKENKDINEAKEWLNNNFELLTNKLNLFISE